MTLPQISYGDPLGRAELLHQLLALAAVDRLERAGLVIDARVQHARVVAGLVEGQLGLLLQHHDPRAGEFPGELVGRRQADDPAADDGHVGVVHVAAPHASSMRREPELVGACLLAGYRIDIVLPTCCKDSPTRSSRYGRW